MTGGALPTNGDWYALTGILLAKCIMIKLKT